MNSNRDTTRHQKEAGFTMIELLTAVTIMGILLAIGIPSFTSTMRNNRLTTLTNSMVTALNIARSEATKRRLPITVCASNTNQTACATSATWNLGWIVYIDNAGTAGVIDTGDTILQVFPPTVDGYPVAPDTTSTPATSATLRYIRFIANGTPDSGALLTAIKLSKPSCTGTGARQVAVSNTGRVTSKPTGC